MTEMLILCDKDLKAAIIKMCEQAMVNVPETNGKIVSAKK